MYDVYQIEVGDTIDTIANKYGTTSAVLRQLNPNSGFGVGSMIVVPSINRYFDVYTIKKGDTLYEIARKYNTDYNLLAMLNGINTADYIYPNTTILVPKKDVKYYFTKNNDSFIKVLDDQVANNRNSATYFMIFSDKCAKEFDELIKIING